MVAALAQSGYLEGQGGSQLRAQGGSQLRAHFHVSAIPNASSATP